MTSKYQHLVLNINDLEIEAKYTQDNIEHLFYPLLKQLTDLQRKLNRRIVVFLAAPPGSGKSTLVSFLESLSNSDKDLTPIQAVGIDGFHYPNDYLTSHFIDNNPNNPSLKTIKGAPNTFDVHKLTQLLSNIQNDNVQFPVYSRVLHNPIDNVITINKKIILLEGNYLLLNHPNWEQLKQFADTTIFIKIDKDILEDRLIQRKQAGGSSLAEAKAHYFNSDKPNVELVLNHSLKADLTLYCDKELHFKII